MFKKVLIIIAIIAVLVCSYSFKISSKNKNEIIMVEIKGEVENETAIELPLGSTFEDLLNIINLKDDADISSFSRLEVLYNNQIINIPKKTNVDLISINSADINSLIKLPGIGESTANRIIEYRERYGSFNSLDELKNVYGIGEKKFEKLKSFICL